MARVRVRIRVRVRFRVKVRIRVWLRGRESYGSGQQHTFCYGWAVCVHSVCAVFCACWWLGGANEGGPQQPITTQHNTEQYKTRQNWTIPHLLLCVGRGPCVCAVLYACWWLGDAEGGGPIKWCCDKTCRKTKGRTTQNPNLTSHLIFTLTYSLPPAPIPYPPSTHLPYPPTPPNQDNI